MYFYKRDVECLLRGTRHAVYE